MSVRLRGPALLHAWLIAALAFTACSTPNDIRRVATDGPPAYDLHGRSLAELQAQAQALCSRGFEVVRQWERLSRPAGHPEGQATSWFKPSTWFAGDDAAQMTVMCK